MKNSTMCSLLGALVVLGAACGSDTDKKQAPFIIIDEPDQAQPQPDQGPSPDMSPGPDMATPGPVVAQEPKGLIYQNDPLTNNRQTTEVVLPKPDEPSGELTNQAVRVLNCVNEMGEPLVFMGFNAGHLCREVQTALPGPDGHYTHHKPPIVDTDPNDTFAEVQMYYHVTKIYDYFKDELGVAGLERIDALTNVQIYANELAAQFLGRPAGWFPFDNAAFLFPESFASFGLPPRPKGAIVFGQGQVADFSYDTSVIYHEYTHSVVGTNRLQGAFPDRWGINNTPGANNEALADYFAVSMLNNGLLGRYSLGAFGPDQIRDLTRSYSCPEDLTSAIHSDGRLIGSMLWAVRKELGAKLTDQIVMRALNSSITATGFDQLVTLLLAEAQRQGGQAQEVFSRVIGERGLDDCERAKEWRAWQATSTPVAFSGTREIQGGSFPDGVPGLFQYWVSAPAGKLPRLSWTLSSGGGGGFGGGGQITGLKLALAKGKGVELRAQLGGATLVRDALLTPPGQAGAQGSLSQSITLGASCLQQGEDNKTYLMLLNPNASGVSLVSTSLTFVDDTPEANATSCD